MLEGGPGCRGRTRCARLVGVSPWWISLGALAGLGAVQVLLPHLIKQVQLGSLARRARGRLILSYDDGPWAGLTPAVLDLLRARGARASFFLIGSKVEAEPQLAARLAAEGHEVGSHSSRHPHPWRTDPVRLGLDLARGHRQLTAAGLQPTGYRPQYGKVVGTTWLWSLLRGQPLRWWTHDSGDSRGERDPAAVVERVRASGGGVVLLHDGVGEGARAEFVLRTTEALLDLAEEQGWPVGGFELLD